MEEIIVNKVANAQIEQIDLIDFIEKKPFVGIDIKELLWNELVLKEKDFRSWVKSHDWSVYDSKNVHLYCSNDAIVPAWAFMLITSELQKANQVYYGNLSEAKEKAFFQNLEKWDISFLEDKRVMVKGCSNIPNPNKAYVILTEKLIPVVKNLMFGEPCSAVPVYKKKK